MCPTKSRLSTGVRSTRFFPALRLVGGDPTGVRSAKAGHRGAGPGRSPAGMVASGPAVSRERRTRRPTSRASTRAGSEFVEPRARCHGTPSRPSFPAFGARPAAGDSLVRSRRARPRLGTNAARAAELDLALHRLGDLRRCDLLGSRSCKSPTTRQTSVTDGLRFAVTNARPLILAPLCPLFGVAVCAAFNASWGLLYRLPAVGPRSGRRSVWSCPSPRDS